MDETWVVLAVKVLGNPFGRYGTPVVRCYRDCSTGVVTDSVVYTEWYNCGNRPKGVDVVTDQKYTLLVNSL